MEILDERKSPFQWHLFAPINEEDIIIRCPKCKRTLLEKKWPKDSKEAKFCESLCPKCDDGDFHTEVFYDEQNNIIEVGDNEG